MADTIDIEVLGDGTIKSTTGKVSNANHKTAEDFFTYLSSLMGGKQQRQRKGHATHVHHQHEHAKQGR